MGPLLKLSRETIERCSKTEYALVSSLQRDPVLADRIKRLKTVPRGGPIMALDRRCLAFPHDQERDQLLRALRRRTKLGGQDCAHATVEQRNKHIQRPLVEAAKLAPRQSHELAVINDKEKQKGNGNLATLL